MDYTLKRRPYLRWQLISESIFSFLSSLISPIYSALSTFFLFRKFLQSSYHCALIFRRLREGWKPRQQTVGPRQKFTAWDPGGSANPGPPRALHHAASLGPARDSLHRHQPDYCPRPTRIPGRFSGPGGPQDSIDKPPSRGTSATNVDTSPWTAYGEGTSWGL